MTSPDAYVRVSKDGSHFVLAGSPFNFLGTNCYYCLVSLCLEVAFEQATPHPHPQWRTHETLSNLCVHTARVQTRAADPAVQHEVTEVLDAAAAAGLTVLRLWAFNDGADQWNALQTSPGEEHSCIGTSLLEQSHAHVVLLHQLYLSVTRMMLIINPTS
jgi:hypothetical protein